MSALTRNSSNPPPYFYDLNPQQQKNWMKTTRRMEKNEELRAEYPPFQSPSNFTIIPLHHYSSIETEASAVIRLGFNNVKFVSIEVEHKHLELKQQHELFEKLKIDYEHQHFYLIEREENIRLLKIELEQHEKLKANLFKEYENQTNQLENNLEQQKLLLLNATQDQDEIFSLKLKQQHELNNYYETSERTINLLEQNLRIAKHDLDIAKQDHDTLQDEINDYKIRAQRVLKQHQLNQRERTPSLANKQIE
ncbi:unnamed protein product [Rotaria sordida]|uniref:Uncharacterized protein n=1 Tax=Rotaria sordida TaxID=392033 RepID=A0A814GEJ8_9BILA|nr:unnamed protein product [Rotaria sordida]CAF0995294.1 unnamed protein product [Rotaria sordida]